MEQILFDTIQTLIDVRYPSGWGGAAAIGLADGSVLTSIAPEDTLDALALCMEVGAILEAHKRNLQVTHSLCLFRPDEKIALRPLTPCGICQERLRFWGSQVMVGITNPNHHVIFKPLNELQPHHWLEAYSK